MLIGSRANLHYYWDDNAVAGAMRAANCNTVDSFAQFLVDNPPANWSTNGNPETWSAQWATEIIPLAKQVLTRLDLGDGMVGEDRDHTLKCTVKVRRKAGCANWASGEARSQVAKAGFRLAAILKAALAGP